ncbi:MAG TPA: ROK family protein [Acidimicrobiales bacterium]|nr:ROK family protein [Acidimicrobiales bacterium]
MAIGLGLDVGGTKILACAVTDAGELVVETRVDSPRSPDRLLNALVEGTDALVALLGADRDSVVGVGVGVPSLVGSDGSLFDSPNLPALEGLPVRAAFAERLEQVAPGRAAGAARWRLVIDNDATCAAAGELAFGAARGHGDVVLLTIGTGIGGGVIAAGRLLRGARGFAGEVGHIVVDPSGPLCHCGRSGCLEQLASGSALARIARGAVLAGRADRVLELAGGDVDAVRGEHVLAAAREGDPAARELFAELAHNLAVGVANLVEVLDPGVVLIGGGLAAAGELLLDPTVAAFAVEDRRGRGAQAVPIVLAELGPRAGAFGAAALALGLVG